MMVGRIADIVTALIVLAGVAVFFTSPETKGVVNAVIGGLVGGIQAATLRPVSA